MKKLDKIYEKLASVNYFSDKNELERFVHALTDIKESIDKIFNENVEEVCNAKDMDTIKEKMWDIREDFRHISYHIEDAKLTE